jgi:hypothetical protein
MTNISVTLANAGVQFSGYAPDVGVFSAATISKFMILFLGCHREERNDVAISGL